LNPSGRGLFDPQIIVQAADQQGAWCLAIRDFVKNMAILAYFNSFRDKYVICSDNFSHCIAAYGQIKNNDFCLNTSPLLVMYYIRFLSECESDNMVTDY
jgi:hypothetical protein